MYVSNSILQKCVTGKLAGVTQLSGCTGNIAHDIFVLNTSGTIVASFRQHDCCRTG